MQSLKEPILLAVFSFQKNIFRGPEFNQPISYAQPAST